MSVMAALAPFGRCVMSEPAPAPIIAHFLWPAKPLPYFGSAPWSKRGQSKNSAQAGGLTGMFMVAGSEFPAVSVCFLCIVSVVSKHVHAHHGWSLSFLHPCCHAHWFSNQLRALILLVWDSTVWAFNMWFKLLTPQGGSLSRL